MAENQTDIQAQAAGEQVAPEAAASPGAEPAAAASAAEQAPVEARPEAAAEPIPATVAARAEDPELDEVEPAAIEQPSDEEPDTPLEKLIARAKRYSADRIRTVLEALLLVSDKPLTDEAIHACTGLSPAQIREGMEKLQGHYRDGVRGIVLHEVAGGWQFRTDPGTSEFVRRFLKVKPQRLTRAALETLAIIAYRQPVTRPEVEDIRAVDCGAVLKALLERRLVKIIGKKEEPGRPLLYGTSKEFLEFFNLRDLASLPTLREFQELSEESREVVDKETPAAAPPPPSTVAELKDPLFEAKLQETRQEADAALEELETALADTDTKTKQTVRLLDPTPPEGEGNPAASAGAPAHPEPDEAEDDEPEPES